MSIKDELNALKGLVKKKPIPENKSKSSETEKQNFGLQKTENREIKKQKQELKKLAKEQVKSQQPKKDFFSFLRKKPKKELETNSEKQGKFAFTEQTKTEEKKDFLSQEKGTSFKSGAGAKESKSGLNESDGSLKDKLMAFYYSLEDGYYNFLDKVNEKIPVYKVIDPIDNIVPSFLLFLGIILVLLILLLSFFVFPPSDQTGKLVLTLTKENSTEIMSGYKINVWVEGNKRTITTDKNAQITLENLIIGSKVKVEVNDVPQYEDFNKSFVTAEKENSFEIELKKKPVIDSGWSSKTIRFKEGSESGRTVTEFLRVSFKCSAQNEIEVVGESSLTSTTTTGLIQIKTKDSCGNVLVSVESTEYEKIDKQVLAENKIIVLTRKENGSKGTIHIKIYDEEGDFIQKKMKFSLFEEGDSSPLSAFDSVSVFDGIKDFSMDPGTYFISVFDPDAIPEYSCSDSAEKELTEEGQITFGVTCTKLTQGDLNGLISVKVIDSASKTLVESTIELLQKKDNRFEFIALKQGSNVSFAVSEDKDFTVIVSSSGYMVYFDETEILNKGSSLTVELVKFTPANSGTAEIKVFDEDGNPASVGKVYLRFGSGALKDYRINSYSSSIGFTGEAVITGISPGNYYAEAITNEQKGISDSKNIDKNRLVNFEVGMKKVRGTVKLNVTKLNSSAKLTGFEVEFFNALSLIKVPESDFVFDEKNDVYSFDEGSYYAIISKQGYHVTRSKNFVVKAKTRATVNIALPQLGEAVEIHFNGLYNLNGEKVDLIDLNKVYSAEFTLAVSPDPDLFYFNFLIGTGRGTSMAQDSLFISSFNNPFTDEAQILKTTSFTGNYQTDFENSANLTEGNSKAVLVEFDDFDKRDFEETAFTVSVEIKLNKEQLTKQTLDANNLILFFKALAVGNSFAEPEFHLDPKDDREFTSLNAYTYSKTKIQELSFCDKPFCYSYLVSSKSSEPDCKVISLGSVSKVKLNCPYEFSSLILNNKEDYSSVDFSIENSTVAGAELDALLFNSFLIKTKKQNLTGNADSRIIQETIDLTKKGLIYSEADFTPIKLVKTINNKIPSIKTALSDPGIIDKNYQELRIRGDSNFNILIDPEEISAFTETNLTIELLDIEGKPIKDAAVILEITDSVSGEKELRSPQETDSLGLVVFNGSERIPALYPLSKVKISVELPDGTISSKEITVSDINTFDFAPKSLKFNFSSIDSSTKTKEINFFDLSAGFLDQKIDSYSVDFSSNSEFFSEQSFREWNGEKFTVEGIITKLNLALDTGETAGLNENLSINSELILNIKINEFDFEKIIPVSIVINAAGGVESNYLNAFFPVNSNQDINSSNPIIVSLFSDDDSKATQFELQRKNIGEAELTINSIELFSDSTYLNLSKMQDSIELQENRLVDSDGLLIDFTAFLSSSASTINQEKIESGEIKLSFDVNGMPDFIVLPFKVEILFSKDTLTVVPDELTYMFELETEVFSQTKTLNFKSDSNFLELNLTDIAFDLSSVYVSAVPPIYSSSITNSGKDINFTLNLTSEGKEIDSSKYFEGEILVEYSAAGRDFNKTIPLTVSILTAPKEIESNSFNLQACIGEGALNDSSDSQFDVSFWIGCNIGEKISSDQCSSEPPKIKLDWSFSSFIINDDYTVNGICGKDTTEYNDYTFCDAAQFSMELFYRIFAFKAEDEHKTGNFHYKATLISDNLSTAFFKDFDEWAMSTLADAPTDYTNQEDYYYNLVRKYFAEGKINVNVFDKEKNSWGSKIKVPGWYDVNVSVEENRIDIDLDLIQSSADLESITGLEDSAFYYIPFDGKIGLKDSEFKRANYGSSFDVQSPDGLFKVNETAGFNIFSSELDGYKLLQVIQHDDFASLNENFYKSALLEIAKDNASKLRTMNFYPTTPTALIMEADLNKTGNALIYYSIYNSLEEEREEILSDNLLTWNGLGKECVDFKGNSTQNNIYVDQKADNSDSVNLTNLDNAFKLYWNYASKTGKTFFTSIVYSPSNAPPRTLKILPFTNQNNNPFTVKLYSKDGLSDSTNSQQNSISLDSSNSLNSLKDLFDLVDQGKACFKNEGNFTYIVWNESEVIADAGIEDEHNLFVESDCITN